VKGAAAVLLAVLAAIAGGCSGGNGGVEPVAASSCGELLYEGEGEPDAVVVSDLPLRGFGAATTRLMVDAIEFVLRQRDFRAGDHRIGYQSCNDTVGEEPYDAALCKRNARAYVAAKDVLGIVGPFNSGCAEVQIPVVSREAAGPLAMVSPSNTFVGLTRSAPGVNLESLYPEGTRSYSRVVTHDLAQGLAAAHLAERLGARRVVVLHQGHIDDPYVDALADGFVRGAESLRLDVVRMDWPLRTSYAQLAASVQAARPDAVYLAGLTQVNANTLVADLRAALGTDVALIGPDSFGAEDIARGLGTAGEGMYVTIPGIPPNQLPPAGRRFMREFGAPAIDPLYVPEAAQAAEVLLDAIGRSNRTRASVVEELFATKVENGIIGSFSFDRNGDIVPTPVGVYRFRDGDMVGTDVVRAPLDALGG
jgi:branched-chain amino acid transport system substrate-binding protein